MKKIPQLSDVPANERAEAERSGTATADAADTAGVAAGRDDATHAAAAHGREASGQQRRAGRAERPALAGRRAARPSAGQKKLARGPARRFARERALQALYQWDMADGESSTVRREFIERQDMSRVDVEYFERLFRGVSHDVEKVDAVLADALDRPLVEVDPIERAVLRIAAYELAEVLETPARVVINEGVEITKRFGADNGHRYVNGVLDGLATTLRPLEMRRG